MSITKQCFKDIADEFVDDTFSDFTKTFTIESLTRTPDGQGGFTSSWATFATITGFVTPGTGTESEKDDRLKSNYLHKFSFQHVAGITNEMRIVYNSENYNIVSIQAVKDADIWIDILANRDVAT